MYTGVRKVIEEDGSRRDHQTQCMAFGDGTDYEKYENNPVTVSYTHLIRTEAVLMIYQRTASVFGRVKFTLLLIFFEFVFSSYS